MGLIKKSVSDIERKLEYAKIVMRVMKECKLMHEFTKYLQSEDYFYFVRKYIRSNPDYSAVWYDRKDCLNILGMANFEIYLELNGKKVKYHTYELLRAYLALFNPDLLEVNKQARVAYINRFLDKKVYEINDYDVEMVKKWISDKKTEDIWKSILD